MPNEGLRLCVRLTFPFAHKSFERLDGCQSFLRPSFIEVVLFPLDLLYLLQPPRLGKHYAKGQSAAMLCSTVSLCTLLQFHNDVFFLPNVSLLVFLKITENCSQRGRELNPLRANYCHN